MTTRKFPWMDHLEAPLPPCTLEALPEPIEVIVGGKENDDGEDDLDMRRRNRRNAGSVKVWPILLGCYCLESAADGAADREGPPMQRRSGRLDLYMVRVPDITSNQPSMPLKFEPSPLKVLDPRTCTGILDSKWWTSPSHPDAASTATTRWFATSHATGEVRIHALSVSSRPSSEKGLVAGPNDDVALFLNLQPNAAVTGSCADLFPGRSTNTPPALCLSLNWREHRSQDPWQDSGTTQIISTYSNGHVAIHDVIFSSSAEHDGAAPPPCHVVTRDCWLAHSLFTSPSEVWSAAFVGERSSSDRSMLPLVATGGDDGSLKLWDSRSTSRPASVVRQPFAAGVTCISPHPRLESVFAAGSYDESLCLFDVRNLSSPLFHSSPLGGGIWRLQWHPLNDRRLLVAAMHGGCQVTQFKGLVPPSHSSSASYFPSPYTGQHSQLPTSLLYPSIPSCPTNSFDSTLTDLSAGTKNSNSSQHRIRWRVKKCFEEHESMVYGAAWLACPHPTQPGSYFEAAASCSFYDRAVYVWDSVL